MGVVNYLNGSSIDRFRYELTFKGSVNASTAQAC